MLMTPAGWLGWPANLAPAAQLFAQVYKTAGSSPFIKGLATNVANYNALSAVTPDPITQGNPNYDEIHYINVRTSPLPSFALANRAISLGSRAAAAVPGLPRDVRRRPGPRRPAEPPPAVGRLVQHQGRRLRHPPDDEHGLVLHRLHRLGQARRRVRRHLQLLVAALRLDLLARECPALRSPADLSDTVPCSPMLRSPRRRLAPGSRPTSRRWSLLPTHHFKCLRWCGSLKTAESESVLCCGSNVYFVCYSCTKYESGFCIIIAACVQCSAEIREASMHTCSARFDANTCTGK